jgi:hypothetical protein
MLISQPSSPQTPEDTKPELPSKQVQSHCRPPLSSTTVFLATPKSTKTSNKGSPTKSRVKSTPSVKSQVIGSASSSPQKAGGYKPSDVDVVLAIFEKLLDNCPPELTTAVAERFGVDKRLLRLVSQSHLFGWTSLMQVPFFSHGTTLSARRG